MNSINHLSNENERVAVDIFTTNIFKTELWICVEIVEKIQSWNVSCSDNWAGGSTCKYTIQAELQFTIIVRCMDRASSISDPYTEYHFSHMNAFFFSSNVHSCYELVNED